MSSSRNKRKRADADTPAIVATISSRRRTREQRSGAEPTDPAAPKNEGKTNADAASLELDIGESSSAADAGSVSTAQHTTTTNANASSAAKGLKERKDDKKEGSSSDVSERKKSSSAVVAMQEPGPEEPNAPQTASVVASSDKSAQGSDKGAASRANQIRSMLSHRKLLLERVRQGRSVARVRISDMARSEAKETTKTAISAGGLSVGNTTTSSHELSEKAKDDAEIAAFKRLTRSALQAAKKQRAHSEHGEGGQEKRTSVSLRRGASVGKNMKAALSSLVPGSSGAASSAGEMPVAQPLHLPLDKTTTVPGQQLVTLTVQRPLPMASVRQNVQQPAGPPSGKRMKTTTTQLSQSASQSTLKGISVPVGDTTQQKGARSGGLKSGKSALNAASGARGMSSAAAPASPAPPLHSGQSGAGLPPNRLALPPPVVCPEAVALRERRNAIRSKLGALLKERQSRMDRPDARGPQNFADLAAQPSADDTRAKLPAFFTSKRRPGPASYMPRRRKTHWDNLLEEMRWMATDFIEERKWKLSAARTLGSAVVSPGVAAASKTIEEAEHNVEANSAARKVEVQSAKAAASKNPSEVEGMSTILRSYSKPSFDDLAAGRQVAKIISNMAYELGTATLDAGTFSISDRVHVKALERHRLVCKEIEQSQTGDHSDTPQTEIASDQNQDSKVFAEGQNNDASAEAAGTDPKEKLGSFERISKAVDSLLETSRRVGRKSSKRKVDTGGKGEAEDLALTASQLEAIEFIEKRWGNSNNPGAVLSGPKSSGKTIAICSLLWKQRNNGPQLLVCSPNRVVSDSCVIFDGEAHFGFFCSIIPSPAKFILIRLNGCMN
jgi:hypothetical protein